MHHLHLNFADFSCGDFTDLLRCLIGCPQFYRACPKTKPISFLRHEEYSCLFVDAQLTMADIKSLLMSSAQLLAGWVALALSTATLGLFPDFPVFSVIDDEMKHDPLRRTHRRVSRHDNAVGMWVAAELVFFCLLTGIAALLYCCCRRQQRRTRTRSGTWYVRGTLR